jgi:mannose-6-phosphate isomerase-like protein (cupin superfamily)
MRFLLTLFASTVVFASVATAQAPLQWTDEQLRTAETKAKGEVDPALHRGIVRLTDSATLIYRTGDSEGEVHTDRADFIVVRSGEASMLIGGTIKNGRSTGPGEVRGDTVEGAKRYRLATGDSLFIPIGIPHQFLVGPGEHLVTLIVKVVPRQ